MMSQNRDKKHDIPMVGFAAYSGTGKTTLLKKLIPEFSRRGIKVSVLKHAHHHFDIDKPGKDSYELRQAGTTEMLIVSDKRLAKVTELEKPITFSQALEHLQLDAIDLVLVEGFKKEPIKKIELYREASLSKDRDFLHRIDNNIVAFACDNLAGAKPHISNNLPLLDINQPEQIVDFIEINLALFMQKI